MSRNALALSGAIVLAMLGSGLWTLSQLPSGAQVTTHFAINGEPDGWSSASLGLFMMPAIATLLLALAAILPRLDPRGKNLTRSSKAYDVIWMSLVIFLAMAQGSIIASAIGIHADWSGYFTALGGGLLIVVGNVLGKIRWNYTVGIRTPWTLANERVWDKTHRFCGWAFVLGGVVVLASVFLLPQGMAPFLTFIGVVMIILLLSYMKSYSLWREQSRQRGE